jgi:hypothetical protein
MLVSGGLVFAAVALLLIPNPATPANPEMKFLRFDSNMISILLGEKAPNGSITRTGVPPLLERPKNATDMLSETEGKVKMQLTLVVVSFARNARCRGHGCFERDPIPNDATTLAVYDTLCRGLTRDT